MSRPALLAVFALVVGACRTAADAEPVGSPDDSVAGTETRSQGSTSKRPAGVGSTGETALATTVVAVATTNAGDAQPCERVCGSLGDCLLTDDDYTAQVAGGLELECLDMCVHSPDSEPAKTEFLACGGESECGQLQACAERNWTALANARRRPEQAGGVVASADPCMAGCRWWFACASTGQPPGEAYIDPQLEILMEECFKQCDNESERQRLTRIGKCLTTHCADEPYLCIE